MMRFRRAKSIRKALLLLLLPAGTALMVLAWLVHGVLLDRMSTAFLESRLQDEVAFLQHQIRQSGGSIDTLETGDYFEEVFHHAFLTYTPSQTIISPQSWGPLLKPLIQSDQQGAVLVEGEKTTGAPQHVLAFRQSFRVNGMPIVVIVAEDMEALRNSQSELHAWTAIVSILLILLLVGVIWVGITLAMRPVGALQAALKKLQVGERSRIDVDAPEEFRPLVLQLNQLLDSLDQRLERSRDALANLSHSVKTPIAAVRQLLEDTTRPLELDIRREMAARLGDIDRQLEAEMRRSRFAGPQVGKSAFPVILGRDLLWMFGRLYPEKSFELSTELTDEHRWPVDEYDLNELLGNLLDNAGKWSSQCVELSLRETQEQLLIAIGDDGPGVAETALDSLGTRGLRLDEQTPGHGLGLAIVADIVQRYSGEIQFSNSFSSGLLVEIAIRHPD